MPLRELGDDARDRKDHLRRVGVLLLRRRCGASAVRGSADLRVSSGVTIHGPMGHDRSRLFPLNHWPCSRCRSRAVTSLSAVYPKITCGASPSSRVLAPRADDDGQLGLVVVLARYARAQMQGCAGSGDRRRGFRKEGRTARELELATCGARTFLGVFEVVTSDAEDVARRANRCIELDASQRDQLVGRVPGDAFVRRERDVLTQRWRS